MDKMKNVIYDFDIYSFNANEIETVVAYVT